MFLVPLLALAACGDAGPPGGWVTTRDTLSSGVVRVTHLPPAEPAPPWTLVEELRVGTVVGDGPDAFGQLKGLVPLDGGGFAVLESQLSEIRVFASDGSHVATHGGRGEGPGEFRDPNGLMVGPEGRLWVPDFYQARMSIFQPEEGFVESHRVNFFSRGWVWNGVMASDGRVFKPSSAGPDWERRVLRVFDRSMNQVDTILYPPDPSAGGDSPYSWRVDFADGGWMSFGVPFLPGASAISPAGTRWAVKAGDPAYHIQRKTLEGDVELEIVMDRPPVPVTAAERDSVMDGIREVIRARGGAPDPDWSKMPRVKPAVASLFASAEGNLWVRRTPSGEAGIEYDVFEPDGAYLGTLATAGLDLAPLEWLSPVVTGEAFWVVATDEFDVPHVVRARIAPAR